MKLRVPNQPNQTKYMAIYTTQRALQNSERMLMLYLFFFFFFFFWGGEPPPPPPLPLSLSIFLHFSQLFLSSLLTSSISGVIVTLDKENHVLTFSMANQSLEGICFIIIPKTKEGNDCSFVNETECIAASTTVSIDPEDDLIVVTYGRALCGDPAHIIGEPFK